MNIDRKRVEHHFEDGQAYEDLLDEADANASAASEKFIEDMRAAWEQYGMKAYLSDGQLMYLNRLADPEEG